MKLLIFSFVIAFILEDYGVCSGNVQNLQNVLAELTGASRSSTFCKIETAKTTFQAKAIKDCKPLERLELFKKYAAELVNSAAYPLRKNEDIMNGGCECTSGIDKKEDLTPLDAILAIMSIAQNYHEELQDIRFCKDEDISKIEIKDDLLVENIRIILVVLERSLLRVDKESIDQYFNPYLLKYKRGLSSAAPGTSRDDKLQSGMKCHLTMASFGVRRNDDFFKKLSTGSYYVQQLMLSDGVEKPERNFWDTELDEIIDTLVDCKLYSSSLGLSMERFEQFLESLSVN